MLVRQLIVVRPCIDSKTSAPSISRDTVTLPTSIRLRSTASFSEPRCIITDDNNYEPLFCEINTMEDLQKSYNLFEKLAVKDDPNGAISQSTYHTTVQTWIDAYTGTWIHKSDIKQVIDRRTTVTDLWAGQPPKYRETALNDGWIVAAVKKEGQR